jgi:uncharacterized protein
MKKWYKKGIQFECQQCGSCCTGAPGFVWVSEAEIHAIAEYMGLDVLDFHARFMRQVDGQQCLIEKPNYDCVLLDDEGHCRVYPVRPSQCKTYPFWRAALQDKELFDECTQNCPGTGQGRVWKVDEIENKAADSSI